MQSSDGDRRERKVERATPMRQDVKLEPGDAIQVKGARTTFQGKPAIIAAEVKKGEETLRLRDEAGVPAWSGWRRG